MFGVQLRNRRVQTQNNARQLSTALQQDIGRKLARCGIFLAAYHQQKLGVACPHDRVEATANTSSIRYRNPSQPGEYPKKRTGFLQASVLFAPTTVSDLERSKAVRIGYAKAAFYGPVLEVMMRRLGLVRSLTDTLSMLSRIMGAPLRVMR